MKLYLVHVANDMTNKYKLKQTIPLRQVHMRLCRWRLVFTAVGMSHDGDAWWLFD